MVKTRMSINHGKTNERMVKTTHCQEGHDKVLLFTSVGVRVEVRGIDSKVVLEFGRIVNR